ncbi:S-methyl-5'-thioadenosine phosphorylase [Candidatus Zixiibacteriota bacterium]
MTEARIGVIGGSGLYNIEGLTGIEEVKPETPFGEPSENIILGELGGVPLAFLPRHGRGHRLTPSEIPVRANIYALKSLGVEQIISVSAVGSLKENLHPVDMVIPDQIIDRTKSRVNTFFGDGLVAHLSFADPFCPVLSSVLQQAASESGAAVHMGGTYICMEGPLFSTKAESNLYRSWGADIIGMTALPEAKLAREAEICYTMLACVTDYDTWHETEESVTVEIAIGNLLKNVATAKDILSRLVTRIPGLRECECSTALEQGIITAPELIPDRIKKDLDLLIGKYIKE